VYKRVKSSVFKFGNTVGTSVKNVGDKIEAKVEEKQWVNKVKGIFSSKSKKKGQEEEEEKKEEGGDLDIKVER